jgi:hypothetical protein
VAHRLRAISQVALLVGSFVAGCATVSSDYPSYTGDDAACIDGFTLSFVDLQMSETPYVYIKEIDGIARTKGKLVCLAPGKHRFGIYAFNHTVFAQDFVDLVLEPRGRYRLSAKPVGMRFEFQLLEGSSERVASVFTFATTLNPQRQTVIPVFIPKK